MNPILIVAAAAAAAAAPDPADDKDSDIIVTASRQPVEARESTVPVQTVGQEENRQVPDLPIAAEYLRGLAGVSVSVSGPKGSHTQVRIRGGEANHTLLFIDGIRFNDPAAGNEPRFELLTSDNLARIDVVRGPQSALWGSEAIGGVVSAFTHEATAKPSIEALAETGSLDSGRLSGRASS